MVAPVKKAPAIKPAEFYGGSLPRPRIFANPQFNSERVNPPTPVFDPLLSWARDAHWSMGGLSFTRLRLQGRIEGKVSKLRAQLEKWSPRRHKPTKSGLCDKKRIGSESPPAAPVAVKRRRFLDLNDEDEEVHSEDEGLVRTRRKLSDDFDRAAGESKMDSICAVGELEGSESDMKKFKKKENEKGSDRNVTRASPRLAKRRSS